MSSINKDESNIETDLKDYFDQKKRCIDRTMKSCNLNTLHEVRIELDTKYNAFIDSIKDEITSYRPHRYTKTKEISNYLVVKIEEKVRMFGKSNMQNIGRTTNEKRLSEDNSFYILIRFRGHVFSFYYKMEDASDPQYYKPISVHFIKYCRELYFGERYFKWKRNPENKNKNCPTGLRNKERDRVDYIFSEILNNLYFLAKDGNSHVYLFEPRYGPKFQLILENYQRLKFNNSYAENDEKTEHDWPDDENSQVTTNLIPSHDIIDYYVDSIPNYNSTPNVVNSIPNFVSDSIPNFVSDSLPNFVSDSIPNFVGDSIPNVNSIPNTNLNSNIDSVSSISSSISKY